MHPEMIGDFSVTVSAACVCENNLGISIALGFRNLRIAGSDFEQPQVGPKGRMPGVIYATSRHVSAESSTKHRSEIIPDAQKIEKNTSHAQDDTSHFSASVRISWARLLKRVFDIDIEHALTAVAN